MVGRIAAIFWRVLLVIDGFRVIGRVVHVTRPSIQHSTLLFNLSCRPIQARRLLNDGPAQPCWPWGRLYILGPCVAGSVQPTTQPLP